MKVKFIYWFAYYNLDSPSVRYRGYYPLEYLENNHQIKSYFVVPGYRPVKILRFLRAYLSALFFRKKDSVIVIQRVRTNFIYAGLLKILVRVHKKRTVYDLDDADYLEHPPRTIFYFIKHCSAVAVGSSELGRILSVYNEKIIINTSPTTDLNLVKEKKNDCTEIGWVGCFGGGHKESMINHFFPALVELPVRVKLTMLGVNKSSEREFLTAYFKPYHHIDLNMPEQVNWRDERSVQQTIKNFDIGIATLLDDELHRCKSAFKIKQYFNNGVPVLSSDIPENNSFVQHGYNGFLCQTPADFGKRITEIAQMDNETYNQLSQGARTSTRYFDVSVYCRQILDGY